MKKSKREVKGHSAGRRARAFRAGVFACVLLGAGVATAVAKYASQDGAQQQQQQPSAGQTAAAATQSRDGLVTVEVGGRKLRVNAQTLQQGPLTPEQARQVADALAGNKSTEGLAQVQHEDGTVSVDLQDRFQNVTLARKNDDGTVSAACVDNAQAAEAFLSGAKVSSTIEESGANRKAAAKE